MADESSFESPHAEPQPEKPATPSPAPTAPAKVYPKIAVRYGRMGFIGEFTYPESMRIAPDCRVVIQTERGIELGEPIRLTCMTCERHIRPEQIRQYVDMCGPEYLTPNTGRILRPARNDDLTEARRLRETEREKLNICQEMSDRIGLSMKLVDCEHILGGERIIFYFLSEGRVDFRELVRDLAREFQTRIEMRQVGARDEARLIADFETCGRECCCKNFLKTLKPITMKMAKMQKATLDPSKVSGRCGRLKCCLRYEQDTYEELDRRLPRMGARIHCGQGEGFVIDRQILTQLILVETEDQRRFTVPVDELTVLERPSRSPARQPVGENDDDNGNAEEAGSNGNGSSGESRQRRGRRGRRRNQGEQPPNAQDAGDQPPPASDDAE